jgi:hypothetical protein
MKSLGDVQGGDRRDLVERYVKKNLYEILSRFIEVQSNKSTELPSHTFGLGRTVWLLYREARIGPLLQVGRRVGV